MLGKGGLKIQEERDEMGGEGISVGEWNVVFKYRKKCHVHNKESHEEGIV